MNVDPARRFSRAKLFSRVQLMRFKICAFRPSGIQRARPKSLQSLLKADL